MSPDSGSPISHLAIPKRTSLILLGPTRIEAFEVGEKASDSRLGKVEEVGSFDLFQSGAIFWLAIYFLSKASKIKLKIIFWTTQLSRKFLKSQMALFTASVAVYQYLSLLNTQSSLQVWFDLLFGYVLCMQWVIKS